jgi:hypothetical protein
MTLFASWLGCLAVASCVNLLCVGSTRSGKTWSELKRLVEAAVQGCIALVVADPHRDSLASPLLHHLVARGLQRRILFDRLGDLARVIGWTFLEASSAKTPLARHAENEASIRAFVDILLRRRELTTVAKFPLIEEWLMLACWLYVEQDKQRPLTDIKYAFQPKHPCFRDLLDHGSNLETVRRFRALARGKVSRAQYGAAARLLAGVCDAPAFAVRCVAKPVFNFSRFLDQAGILLVEGGGESLSDDAMRAIMGAIILRTIRYVRSRPRPYPPVILAIDEVNNAGLFSSFEARALAETAKYGLAQHVLTQQLNFPNPAITEGVLSNTLVHEWFGNNSPAVRRVAAADLGDREFADLIRTHRVGECSIKDRHTVVARHYVVPLENPWGWPELLKRKGERALREIQLRPEYHTPSWSPPGDDREQGTSDGQTSPDDNPLVGI